MHANLFVPYLIETFANFIKKIFELCKIALVVFNIVFYVCPFEFTHLYLMICMVLKSAFNACESLMQLTEAFNFELWMDVTIYQKAWNFWMHFGNIISKPLSESDFFFTCWACHLIDLWLSALCYATQTYIITTWKKYRQSLFSIERFIAAGALILWWNYSFHFII